MSSLMPEVKEVGFKKFAQCNQKRFALTNKCLVDGLRNHEICKAFAEGCVCTACLAVRNFFMDGGDLNVRDSQTGETLLHILADYIHLYLTPNGVRIVYTLSTKIDLDVPDRNGDTVLHKVVRVPGAWRCIMALMRCGACTFPVNNAGRTPEEEILFHKNQGWQENLHWFRKFKPGLWAAVKSENPDLALIERLLRYWCRTTRVIGTEAMNLKYQAHLHHAQLDTVCILEKYENTNELALAMLSGKARFINIWKLTEDLQNVDINTKEHSYQFYYRDYPTAPRPLLAAVWEIDQPDLIEAFMELRPDTTVKYTFESETTSPPKPLFFQLVNPKSRPSNHTIVERILRDTDLSIRNIQGQTVLVEAMYNGETEGIIRTILGSGINVGARDSHGRTARDHCDILQRNDYRELIDSHIHDLVKDGDINRLESLVLQLYDGIFQPGNKCHLLSMARSIGSKQLSEVLKNADNTQTYVRKLFAQVKEGNKAQVVKLMSRKYANSLDKAGRTLLHYAIQHLGTKLGNIKSKRNRTSGDGNTYNNNMNSSNEIQNKDIILDDISVRGVGVERVNGRTSDKSRILSQSSTTTGPFKNYKKLVKEKKCGFLCRGSCHNNFTPDHKGIVEYFLKEFPAMLGKCNNLCQTPLHYAYIYSAGEDIEDLLKNAGANAQFKDVFDFVPEDYNCRQCGRQTFEVRRRPTAHLDLDIFLTESDFESQFQNAVMNGNMSEVKKLVVPLLEHDGEARFSGLLFDCLDRGYNQLASFLVDTGFPTDIAKQYEMCNPDNPMCAMMECGHMSTTFRQRAQELGATDLVRQIDELSLSQTQSITLAE